MNKTIRKLGRRVKAWYYRRKLNLKDVDKSVYFGGHSKISPDIIVGHHVYFGPGCNIYPNVEVGDFTLFANNISIIGGDHRYDVVGLPVGLTGRDVIKKTLIGRDCWIGAHSIIKCGVTVADGCIVAAGAVVTKDTEPYGIYAGVPAIRIKERFSSEEDMKKHIEMISKISFEEADALSLINGKLIDSKAIDIVK